MNLHKAPKAHNSLAWLRNVCTQIMTIHNYIQQLEEDNERLKKDNEQLKNKRGFE